MDTIRRAAGVAAVCAATVAMASDSAQREAPPGARLDAWRVIGPGGGGTMVRPQISPHDPDRVVEGCDMTGAYITENGGESWRMFNLGTVVSSFAFDSTDPQVIYAGNMGLWRSGDAGRTWRLVFPDPARRSVLHGWGDHADVVLTSEDPAYLPWSGKDVTVHAIAVDPSESKRVYIAASATDPGPPGSHPQEVTALLASEDHGKTWTRHTTFSSEKVFAIAIEGTGAGRLVHALGETGVYEGKAGRWQRFGAPGPFNSGGMGRDRSATLIYATTPLSWTDGRPGGGIHVSSDGGRTWTLANTGLADTVPARPDGQLWGAARVSRPALGPVAVSARHGKTAYVGLRGVKLVPGSETRFNGIARTTDGGRTWSVVHQESDEPSAQMAGSWFESRAVLRDPNIWFDAPYDLAVAPGNPDVCYATDLFRTYRTRDGGKTWRQVHSARAGSGWTTRGLDVTSSYGVHFDPFDPRAMLITYTDIGLFRSEDGGASWMGATEGIPREWRNTTYWVVLDPDVKGLLWGAFSANHDLPRPKMWRRTDPGTYQGGVAVSMDGGRTWTPSATGLQPAAFTHILLDPRSPKGARTLYAAAFGRGVYKSRDNGRTWSLKNEGLEVDERNQPFAWRMTLAPNGALYLVVARRSERGQIGDRDDGALYRSMDGAAQWTRMTLPLGTNGPNALTVDPTDPRRLYLSAWGRATPGGDTGGGLFLSIDGGATWTNLLPQSQHVYDATVDPRDPNVLYASGFDQSAYRSTDRGRTWKRIRGYNFKWGHRVVPDPADAARVYITTYGGSVWHGPAAGDPSATEDTVVQPARADRLDE